MVRMAESGERKFVCKVFGKGFKTKYGLSAHGTTHTANERPGFNPHVSKLKWRRERKGKIH